MFEDFSISPYPGLRSFSEDESLFFKGRDQNIQEIIKLLQANKFLMVTGASGDGKSSIIFSGLVPNARAGFFKANYNRWEVAHFRPERTPVKNFAKVLSGIFNSPQETLRTELSRGYGSLVDLYKGSDLYKDETTTEWQNADEDGKKSIERSTANLLVIVDQFEEFFTNPENFRNGSPTEEAQTLINLLLETAKISLNDDIPIYVVFTMRSDYIGQCAAFRGLPEFIGFSQFFVPRLKRKELKQIIEEPAVLNGNSISPRLVERILYDLSEGIDQLPILQHALSQIWLTAKEGKEEMDLLHYAKLGGMPAEDLPKEERQLFDDWYATLEVWEQENFNEPGLDRILDIHADQLYEGAWEYYQLQNNKKAISKKEAKFIIAMTFACLTKIDHSRAVRNRMTLQEITDIINQPKLTTEVVGAVINTYREQGNTFVRPFIDENNTDSAILKSGSVLDITHESLIRNWQKLAKWADKEFEYYETFLDFEQQLEKWLNNAKDKGYLLPIGPLTFFENWDKECRPNRYWINRYNTIAENPVENLKNSEDTLNNSRQFLKKSSRNVIISKTFMKYGSMRIAAAFAVAIVFILSGFYYFDAGKKQNKAVLNNMSIKARSLITSQDVGSFDKSLYILNLERVFRGSMLRELKAIPVVDEKLEVAINTYGLVLLLDQTFDSEEKYKLINFIDQVLESNQLTSEKILYRLNLFIDVLGYDYYLNNRARVGTSLQNQTEKLPGLINQVIKEGNIDRILSLNQGIENYINWNNDPKEEIDNFLAKLSPFDSSSYATFNKFYPQKGGILNGRVGNISHNGGYQVIASLLAAKGELANVKKATDSILSYNERYFDVMSFNHGSNILGYFVQFDYQEEAEEYLSYLSDKSGLTKRKLMNYTLDHAGYLKHQYTDIKMFDESNYNPGLSILHRRGTEYLFDLYEKIIREEEDGDREIFYLSLLYKQRGSYLSWQQHLSANSIPQKSITDWFDKALITYSLVSDKFKNESEEINYRYYSDGIRLRTFTHKYFFLYPDYFYDQWHSDKFVSSAFMEYLLKNQVFNDFYSTSDELEVINDWLANYNEYYPFTNQARNLGPFDHGILDQILQAINNHPSSEKFDNTFINLLLTNYAFSTGDDAAAMRHFNELDFSKIGALANRWQYLNYTFIYNQLVDITKALASRGLHSDALRIIESLPDYQHKTFVYSTIANHLYKHNNEADAFLYLDSAFVNESKLDPDAQFYLLNPYISLISTLSGIGSQALNNKAKNLFVEMPAYIKDDGLSSYITGIAYEGNYYRAIEAIPQGGSSNMELQHYITILNEEANKNNEREGWEKLGLFLNYNRTEYIIFRDQN